MRESPFDSMPFGKAALEMLGPVPENFRLYEACLEPQPPKATTHMRVTGAEFRTAKTGKNKGMLCVMVPGSQRTVRVPREAYAS